MARAARLLQEAADDQERARTLLQQSARKVDVARNILQCVFLLDAWRRRRAA